MYTQCPDCRTVYRIATSDLRQAQGRVRCGSCGASFNALQSLSEARPEESPPAPPVTGPGVRTTDEPPPSIQDTGEYPKPDIPGDTLVLPAMAFTPDIEGEDAEQIDAAEPQVIEEHDLQEPETAESADDAIAVTAEDTGEKEAASTDETEVEPESEDAEGRREDAEQMDPAEPQVIEEHDRQEPETAESADDAIAVMEEDTGEKEAASPDETEVEPESETAETPREDAEQIDAAEPEVIEEHDRQEPETAEFRDDAVAVAGEEAGEESAPGPDETPLKPDQDSVDALIDAAVLAVEEASSEAAAVADEERPSHDDSAHTESASYTEDWAEALLRETRISPAATEPSTETSDEDEEIGTRSRPDEPGMEAPRAEAADSDGPELPGETTEAAPDAGLPETDGTDVDDTVEPDHGVGWDGPGSDLAWEEDAGSPHGETWTEPDFSKDIELPEALEGGPGFASDIPRAEMQKPASTGLPRWVDQYAEDEFEEIELPGTLDGRGALTGETAEPTDSEEARETSAGTGALAAPSEAPPTTAEAAGTDAASTAATVSDTSEDGSAGIESAAAWTEDTTAVGSAAVEEDKRLPRELDPNAGQPRTGQWQKPALIAVVVAVVAAIVVHAQRADLMRSTTWGPVLESVYGVFGATPQVRWDIGAFRILESSASADASGDLTVNARFANGASFAQPFPTLRVTLENRWGQALDRQDFDAATYLSEDTAGRRMRTGEQVVAVITLPSPGIEAVGFSVDLCLGSPDTGLKCLTSHTGN